MTADEKKETVQEVLLTLKKANDALGTIQDGELEDCGFGDEEENLSNVYSTLESMIDFIDEQIKLDNFEDDEDEEDEEDKGE